MRHGRTVRSDVFLTFKVEAIRAIFQHIVAVLGGRPYCGSCFILLRSADFLSCPEHASADLLRRDFWEDQMFACWTIHLSLQDLLEIRYSCNWVIFLVRLGA